MSEALTAPVKYVFVDVVSFTTNRSVEAQSDIVGALNSIVSSALAHFNISRENIILLPTGDGLCAALVNVETPYDVHVELAVKIIDGVADYNRAQDDEQRRFVIRVGINSNIDNIVTDINGNRNVAGAGINMASRVMSVADGNQIIVASGVYDILRYREKYQSAFRAYSATVKHGVQIPVYQLISPADGLNLEVPTRFRARQETEPRLEGVVAYYFGLAIKHRQLFTTLGQRLSQRSGVLWAMVSGEGRTCEGRGGTFRRCPA